MINPKMPQLSIIIPTYNRRQMLEECIDAFHGKLVCSYEVVIVDDGSTDDTWDYLQTLPSTLFVVVRQENAGSNSARNRGLEGARGEYVLFLDSDDLLISSQIDKQVQYLENNSQYDVCLSDFTVRRNSGQDENHIRKEQAENVIDMALSRHWAGIGIMCIMARTSLAKGVGFRPKIRRYQELDYLLNLALNGAKIKYLSGSSGVYVEHNSERMQDRGKVDALQYKAVILADARDLLEAHGQLNDKRRHELADTFFSLAENMYDFDKRLYRRFLYEYVFATDRDWEHWSKTRARFAKVFGYELSTFLVKNILQRKPLGEAYRFLRRST